MCRDLNDTDDDMHDDVCNGVHNMNVHVDDEGANEYDDEVVWDEYDENYGLIGR